MSLPRSTVGPITDLPVSRTALQSVTRPLSIFNAPANALKSLIRAGQEGDLSYVGNAIQSLIPFAGSEDIPIEDITGSDSALTNFAADIALDPLLFVGGIGTATKAGKAVSGARTALKDLKAAKALARTAKTLGVESPVTPEFISELEKITKGRTATAKALKGTMPSRALLNVGLPFTEGVNVGDFQKVRDIAAKVKLLPDPLRVQLVQKAQKLQKQISKAEKGGVKPEKIEELTNALAEIESQAQNLNEGLLKLGPDKALQIERWKNKFAGLFRSKPRAEGQAVIKELTEGKILSDTFKLSRENEVMVRRLRSLQEKAGLADEEFNNRLLRIAEARFVANGESLPDVAKMLETDTERLIKSSRKYAKKQIAAKKFDKEAFKVKFETALFKIKKKAEIRRLRLDEAQRIMGDAGTTSEWIEFVDDYITPMEQFVDKVAKPLGINVQKLQSSHGLVSWVPRLPNVEMLQKLRKSNPSKFARLQSDIKLVMSGSHRRKVYPEFDIPSANKLMREKHGIDFDYFDTNVAKLIATRRREHYIAASKATAVHALAEAYGLEKKAEGLVPAANLFKAAGLDVSKAPQKFIPESVLEDAKGFSAFLQQQMTKPETGAIRTAMNVISQINKPFHIALTTAFPAFHHRNMVNNIFVNHWAKDIGLSHYSEMARLQRVAARGELAGRDLELWEELVRNKIVDRGVVQQYTAHIKNAKLQAFIDRPFSGTIDILKGRIDKEDIVRPLHRNPEQFDMFIGSAYGKFLEDNARGAHYLGKRSAGLSQLEASRSVKKYLFNPEEISKFEKEFVKPLFLFYSWTRNNVPLMLKLAFTEPRPAAIYSKLIGSDDAEVPNYLRGGFALKAPFLGPGEYIGSAGLGIEDLLMFNVADADPSGNPLASADQIRRIVERGATRLSPALKVPFELITGKESYTRRRYEDIPVTSLLSRASPASRVMNVAEQFSRMLSGETTIPSTLVDFMTGFRTYKINEKSARIQSLQRKLLSTGKFTRLPLVVTKQDYKKDESARALDRRLRKLIQENTK